MGNEGRTTTTGHMTTPNDSFQQPLRPRFDMETSFSRPQYQPILVASKKEADTSRNGDSNGSKEHLVGQSKMVRDNQQQKADTNHALSNPQIPDMTQTTRYVQFSFKTKKDRFSKMV